MDLLLIYGISDIVSHSKIEAQIGFEILYKTSLYFVGYSIVLQNTRHMSHFKNCR
jgi:hypothetical protein